MKRIHYVGAPLALAAVIATLSIDWLKPDASLTDAHADTATHSKADMRGDHSLVKRETAAPVATPFPITFASDAGSGTDAPGTKSTPQDAGQFLVVDSPGEPLQIARDRPSNSSDAGLQDTRAHRNNTLQDAERRVTAVGLCTPDEVARRSAAREKLLAQFSRADTPLGVILYDPVLPETVPALVQTEWTRAVAVTTELLMPKLAIPNATVVAYRSVNQMLEVSCVNRSSFGYYDGAVHLSGNPNNGFAELSQTLIHEYTHHVLLHQGVRLPLWLSEGAAMVAAQEVWWRDPSLNLMSWVRTTHLPFTDLVTAFSHASDERTATYTYFQSYLMVQFVQSRGPTALGNLVSQLGAGTVGADQAFEAAAGVTGEALEREWTYFISSQ